MATKPFIVGKQEIRETQPEEFEYGTLEFSGDAKRDLETAILAIAFLLDFVDSVGGSLGLRACADEMRDFRKEQR